MTETDTDGAGDSLAAGLVTTPLLLPNDSGIRLAEAAGHDFDGVYAEFFPFVWRCLRGLGVAPSLLDDAAQDVFVVVHRRFSDFRGRSSVRTWLYGITRNVASNYRRSVRRRAHLTPLDAEPPSPGPGPLEHAENAQAVAFVQRFASELDAKKRDVFLLAMVEEMSMPEVAEALGIPVNTAYTRLRLVRADLERALEKEPAR
jgi:RNA polymerase sigma-70 factor (ECF subfamily)